MGVVQAGKETVLEKPMAGRIDDARIAGGNFVTDNHKKDERDGPPGQTGSTRR
jgi:hypothetical protein